MLRKGSNSNFRGAKQFENRMQSILREIPSSASNELHSQRIIEVSSQEIFGRSSVANSLLSLT